VDHGVNRCPVGISPMYRFGYRRPDVRECALREWPCKIVCRAKTLRCRASIHRVPEPGAGLEDDAIASQSPRLYRHFMLEIDRVCRHPVRKALNARPGLGGSNTKSSEFRKHYGGIRSGSPG
jgi:hypothetical protein